MSNVNPLSTYRVPLPGNSSSALVPQLSTFQQHLSVFNESDNLRLGNGIYNFHKKLTDELHTRGLSCLDAEPLLQVLEIAATSKNQNLKKFCLKAGKLTSLGKIIEEVMNYLENPTDKSAASIFEKLDTETMNEAINQAQEFLKQEGFSVKKKFELPSMYFSTLDSLSGSSSPQYPVQYNPIDEQYITVDERFSLSVNGTDIFNQKNIRSLTMSSPSELGLNAEPLTVGENVLPPNLNITQTVDGLQYAITNNGEIKILNLSNIIAPIVVSTINGKYKLFKVIDNILVALTEDALEFRDISNNQSTQLIARFNSSTIPKLKSIETIDGRNGLVFINIPYQENYVFPLPTQNSPLPQVLSDNDPNLSNLLGLQVLENNVLIKIYMNYVRAYNVSSPSTSPLWSFSFVSNNLKLSVACQGNKLFVAQYGVGVMVVDTIDSKKTRLINTIKTPSGNHINNIMVQGNILGIIEDSIAYFIDLMSSTLKITRTVANMGDIKWAKFINNSQVCISFTTGDKIFDLDLTKAIVVSNGPFLDNQIGYYNIEMNADLSNGTILSTRFGLTVDKLPELIRTSISDINILPNIIKTIRYKLSKLINSYGLMLLPRINLADGNDAPDFISLKYDLKKPLLSYPLTNAPRSMVYDDNIYILDDKSNLIIFDPTIPLSTTPAYSLDLSTLGFSLAQLKKVGNLLYASGNGLCVLDVSVIPPVILSKLNYNAVPGGIGGGGVGFAAYDNIGAVQVINRGFQLFNLANSTSIAPLNSLRIVLPSVKDFALFDNILYLAEGAYGVELMAIDSNLQGITPLGFLPLPKDSVAVRIRYLAPLKLVIVAASSGGAILADVSNPLAPIIKTIFRPDNCDIQDAVVIGRALIVADANFGLRIADIADNNMKAVGESQILDSISKLDVQGNKVVVVGKSSAKVFEVDDISITINPEEKDKGNHLLEFTTTNSLEFTTNSRNGIETVQFTIFVQGPPQFSEKSRTIYATVGNPISFNFRNSLSDPNFDQPFISSRSDNNTEWLELNPIDFSFSGAPNKPGTYIIQLTAKDKKSKGSDFATVLIDVKHEPVANFAQSQIPPAQEGKLFTYQFPEGTITQLEGLPLAYTLVAANGGNLPDGFKFDSLTRIITWEKPVIGIYYFKFQASDSSNRAATIDFAINVAPKQAPKLLNPIPEQIVHVGEKVTIEIPAGTFDGYEQLTTDTLPDGFSFDPQLKERGLTCDFSRGSLTSFKSPNSVMVTVIAKNGPYSTPVSIKVTVPDMPWGEMLLKFAGIPGAIFAVIYGLFKNRAYYYNWKNKNKLNEMQGATTMAVGQKTSYRRQLINGVPVLFKTYKVVDSSTLSSFKLFSLKLFGRPACIPLSGGGNLPSFIEYNHEENVLRANKNTPSSPAEYLIESIGDDGVILERIKLKVINKDPTSNQIAEAHGSAADKIKNSNSSARIVNSNPFSQTKFAKHQARLGRELHPNGAVELEEIVTTNPLEDQLQTEGGIENAHPHLVGNFFEQKENESV